MNTHSSCCAWLLVAAGWLAACSSPKPASESAAAETFEIAVIPKGTTHRYWKTVHAGAAKAARELGVKLYWQGPLREDDRQVQIQTVQNFISRGVDAIALAPLDSRSLVPSVKSARIKRIPVIIFDSDLDSPDYESFVATDNREGGRLGAQRLAEVLDEGGKVILLRYNEGSASNVHREEGFLEGIKKAGKNLTLVSTDQHAGVTMESALRVAQNLLNRYPAVDGIFCPNEIVTQAMLRALKITNRAGKVKLVGFDANETLIGALRTGEIHGLVVQDPFKMGYLAVKTARQVLLKEPFDQRIDTGVMVVTPDNMEAAAIRSLLYPDVDRWLKE